MRLTVNVNKRYHEFPQVVSKNSGVMICGVDKRICDGVLEYNFHFRVDTIHSILNTLQLR